MCEEQAAHPCWHYVLEFWCFRCNLTHNSWERTWRHFLLNFFALGCPIEVVLKAETVSEIRLNQPMFSLPEGSLYRFADFHLPLWFQAAYQTQAVKIAPLFCQQLNCFEVWSNLAAAVEPQHPRHHVFGPCVPQHVCGPAVWSFWQYMNALALQRVI